MNNRLVFSDVSLWNIELFTFDYDAEVLTTKFNAVMTETANEILWKTP